jgi:diguanylate cyclase (GGDEF)-like protein
LEEERSTRIEMREIISRLQEVIAANVREELRYDPLTGLRNGLALSDELEERTAAGAGAFWIAFVEVDRFKSLNVRFGYEKADAVLRQIARVLDVMRKSFPGETTAFHAHGDEFYLVGRGRTPSSDTIVEEGLNAVRQAIAAIKLEAGNEREIMTCTVSVGWLTSKDLGDTRSPRQVLDALELAVARAKRDRNIVVRFSPSLKHETWISLRADCAACDCQFSYDVKRESAREDSLWCPNCGERVARPPLPLAEERVAVDKIESLVKVAQSVAAALLSPQEKK